MKKSISLVLTALLLSIPMSSHAGVWDSVKGAIFGTNPSTSPKIDVLILNDQPSVMVEVQGKYKVYDPNTERYLGTRIVGKRKMIQPLPIGLKWGEEFPSIYQIQIITDDADGKIFVNGNEYRGSIFVYDIGGSISIVNRVDIEDYLKSSLSSQFREQLPEETIASAAIVARTYALYLSQNQKNFYWSVDGQQVGYQGVNSVNANTPIVKALEATKDMVLSQTGAYEGKITPIAAQWGSGTGSRAPNQNVVFSRISLYEAEVLGKDGRHAAQILAEAFPETHIELVR